MIAGIYGIFIGAKLVYIGKSKDMVKRRAQHWSNIYNTEKGIGNIEDKYKCLVAAKQSHLPIVFKIIKETNYKMDELEKDYIKTYKPYLNTVYGDKKVIDVNEFLEFVNSTIEDMTCLYVDGKAVGELEDIPTKIDENKYEKQAEENRIVRLETKVDSLLEMTTKILEILKEVA